MERQPRNWFRFAFTLRTLFAITALIAVWFGYHMNWIRQRQAALVWIADQAEFWKDVPVEQGARHGGNAPWRIRMLGANGIQHVLVVVKNDELVPKERELKRLFPETSALYTVTPGKGYHGRHADLVHPKEQAAMRFRSGRNDPSQVTEPGTGYLGVVPDEGIGDRRGVPLISVRTGAPADTAGLMAGDVITSINDQPCRDFADFDAALAKAAPGSVLSMVVSRDGKPRAITVTLGERRGQPSPPPAAP